MGRTRTWRLAPRSALRDTSEIKSRNRVNLLVIVHQMKGLLRTFGANPPRTFSLLICWRHFLFSAHDEFRFEGHGLSMFVLVRILINKLLTNNSDSRESQYFWFLVVLLYSLFIFGMENASIQIRIPHNSTDVLPLFSQLNVTALSNFWTVLIKDKPCFFKNVLNVLIEVFLLSLLLSIPFSSAIYSPNLHWNTIITEIIMK